MRLVLLTLLLIGASVGCQCKGEMTYGCPVISWHLYVEPHHRDRHVVIYCDFPFNEYMTQYIKSPPHHHGWVLTMLNPPNFCENGPLKDGTLSESDLTLFPVLDCR
jgi:hypothetical protein